MDDEISISLGQDDEPHLFELGHDASSPIQMPVYVGVGPLGPRTTIPDQKQKYPLASSIR